MSDLRNAIPIVLPMGRWRPYHSGMETWEAWGARLRRAYKGKKKRWQLAKHMSVSESQIGHWTNGTRDIGVRDLMRLCEFVGADPAVILFGGPVVPADAPEEVRQALGILAKIKAVPISSDNINRADTKEPRRKNRK